VREPQFDGNHPRRDATALLAILNKWALCILLISALLLVLAACASTPKSHPRSSSSSTVSEAAGDRAAGHAAKMLGRPYHFGGSSPSSGFDCSGLVQYSFRQAGVSVPRATESQRSASRAVRLSDLRRGDLIFFDQEGKKNSHVGIYLGGGRFVHAPSSGKEVRSDRLDAPYWKKHLSETRRLAV
jgi:cell wall-associated NlpC family hydrolase